MSPLRCHTKIHLFLSIKSRNTFQTPDIRLDYAFAEYSAAPWLTLYGGKFKRKPVVWQPSDLLWDSDINPEGGAITINKGLMSNLDLFFNTGVFVLDESSSDTSDPMMYSVQPGFNWKISDDDGITYSGNIA